MVLYRSNPELPTQRQSPSAPIVEPPLFQPPRHPLPYNSPPLSHHVISTHLQHETVSYTSIMPVLKVVVPIYIHVFTYTYIHVYMLHICIPVCIPIYLYIYIHMLGSSISSLHTGRLLTPAPSRLLPLLRFPLFSPRRKLPQHINDDRALTQPSTHRVSLIYATIVPVYLFTTQAVSPAASP